MLEVSGIEAGYGAAPVLRGVTFAVAPGEVVCLFGRNGAGKTTTLKAVMGLIRVAEGAVRMDGRDLGRMPAHRVPIQGIGYVPQGRRLFAELTVAENLQIGLMTRGRDRVRDRDVCAGVLERFPVLAERLDQVAGTLSGGEQQMLAIARALCLEPRVLLLDEPGEGLQPSMVAMVAEVVRDLRAAGVAVLLVEQRIDTIGHVADRVCVIENGRDVATLPAADFAADVALHRRFGGVDA